MKWQCLSFVVITNFLSIISSVRSTKERLGANPIPNLKIFNKNHQTVYVNTWRSSLENLEFEEKNLSEPLSIKLQSDAKTLKVLLEPKDQNEYSFKSSNSRKSRTKRKAVDDNESDSDSDSQSEEDKSKNKKPCKSPCKKSKKKTKQQADAESAEKKHENSQREQNEETKRNRENGQRAGKGAEAKYRGDGKKENERNMKAFYASKDNYEQGRDKRNRERIKAGKQ